MQRRMREGKGRKNKWDEERGGEGCGLREKSGGGREREGEETGEHEGRRGGGIAEVGGV